ncbi:MAG TPA: winged helix DNA-binding protein [Bacteroidales bacterium]|nr:winged helix DNA-binding protein [Bacteroidales bacterium]
MDEKQIQILKLGRMMHGIFKLFKKRLESVDDLELRISPELFGILRMINAMKEEVIQKDISELLGKDKSAVLRMIDLLEEQELVRRVVDLKDRRKNCLMITKQGGRLLEQYQVIENELIEEMSDGLEREEIAVFNKVIDVITSRLNKG